MFVLKALLDKFGSNEDDSSSGPSPSANEGGGGSSKGGGAPEAVDPNDTTNLGLGGLPSFFGYRKDAAMGRRGDAQIAATLNDNLPGYFNPETRDYVPWYVDLFDGGGINRSAGMLDAQPSAQGRASGSAMPATQPQGLLANNQLSDMERMQRSDPLRPFGGFGPEVQGTPDTSYYTQPSSMLTPFRTGPEAPGYTQPSSMQVPTPQGVQPLSMQVPTPAGPGMPAQNNAEYEQFVKFLSDNGGFTRELQNPEWMQRAFSRYMRSLAN